MPLPDLAIELRVEHVGFETLPYVPFTAGGRSQPIFLFAQIKASFSCRFYYSTIREQDEAELIGEGSLLVE